MDISAKFSLYDVLAKIIPGWIIMAAINPCDIIEWLHNETATCSGCVSSTTDGLDLMQCAILLSSSYVLGLINNWINDGIFCGFRNNRYAIENELMRTLRDNENLYLKNHGIIWSRRGKPMVKKQIEIIKSVFKSIYNHLVKHQHFKNQAIYYRFYYALSQRNLLGSIPMIESQIALLRNTLLPISVLAIIFCVKDTCLWLFMMLAVIPLFLVMIQRQNKIYNLIWESANYYKL